MTREEDYQLSRSMRKEPLEDHFVRVTDKQIRFIEELTKSLGYVEGIRNAQIQTIIKKWFDGDMFGLSRSEASQIIDKFKQWKEERK